MNQLTLNEDSSKKQSTLKSKAFLFKAAFAGLLFPLGFAPYHLSGMTIISLAFFYSLLSGLKPKKALLCGFLYGFAMFGFGVSWVIISIHDYGSFNYVVSGLITLAFLAYLSLYPALLAGLFSWLNPKRWPLLSTALFASLWIMFEYARSTMMTGFPWLLAGTSQSESPLKYLAPLFGNYGVGFFVALAAAFLVLTLRQTGLKRVLYTVLFMSLILFPLSLKSVKWTKVSDKPVSVAVIQANLSMRDKWDENLFWQLLDLYKNKTSELLSSDLIVLPENAIPIPSSFVKDFLDKMNLQAKLAQTAIVLGVLHPSKDKEDLFYNAMITLGQAKGHYAKRHLVPFGEYIPNAFKLINKLALVPELGMVPGKKEQKLIHIGSSPVASVICYEIAYPALFRHQIAQARWIISISDNGWFGHSLASYQQQQMAQMLSLQTGRFLVLANNDGLSSVINNEGSIVDSLPPFQAGVLQSKLYRSTGKTPWVKWGDFPVLLFSLFIIIFTLLLKIILKPVH